LRATLARAKLSERVEYIERHYNPHTPERCSLGATLRSKLGTHEGNPCFRDSRPYLNSGPLNIGLSSPWSGKSSHSTATLGYFWRSSDAWSHRQTPQLRSAPSLNILISMFMLITDQHHSAPENDARAQMDYCPTRVDNLLPKTCLGD